MEHNCKICNKIYSTSSSLSNHKKKFHNENIIKYDKKNEENKLYNCKYCEKKYKSHTARWSHEKKCIIKVKDKHEDEKQIIIDKLKDEIIELQKKLIKTNNKVSTRTFKAINKILKERSYIKNSQNNNTNSLNTITNNNKIIYNIGNEELVKVLTMKEKKQIINSRLNAMERIVEIAHCSEYHQFKNIVITNLHDNFAYKYDSDKGYFVTGEKQKVLTELFDNRKEDIEEIYHELESANKIDARTKQIIQNFLDNCSNELPYLDENDTKFPSYKICKINNVKILLYNNQDKITKDIELMIL
uniref:C2H2-type domain-containing protein n=1 Tax=viral metagenome TaxID=1070528 RepID=A0A6C0HYT2_9ZZZZ